MSGSTCAPRESTPLSRAADARALGLRTTSSNDGTVLCVGDGSGNVYVFSIGTGKLLTELQHKRSRQPVRACAFNATATCVL